MTLVKSGAFVGSNCNNRIVLNGMENVKFFYQDLIHLRGQTQEVCILKSAVEFGMSDHQIPDIPFYRAASSQRGYYIYQHTLTIYSVILSVLDPRKCEYLKDYSLDFEHAYMTTYLAS